MQKKEPIRLLAAGGLLTLIALTALIVSRKSFGGGMARL